MISTPFDIYSDFYAASPEFSLLFSEEISSKVSSRLMWALVLFVHPASKFANLDSKSKLELIRSDYLPGFDPSLHEHTLTKIEKYALTPIQRVLSSWNDFLEDRELFMKQKYDASNFEMLDKMRKDTYPMMKQYKEILKEFSNEQQTTTHGDAEESLSEKGLI